MLYSVYLFPEVRCHSTRWGIRFHRFFGPLISWKSTKTHRFGQNYATSSNKVPCFGVWINFSAKGSKKRLISWKSTKKHRFGQDFANFGTNYYVFGFRWTFQEKVTKRASFRERERKIIDFAKTLQLFEQTTMSLHFDELFRKKLQKVVIMKNLIRGWVFTTSVIEKRSPFSLDPCLLALHQSE